MQITKVLENEVGVQFDRVKDNTGSTGTALINGVITGSFKRGRTDKQMQITQNNIKAVLGYDPDNPDYVAVQDALNTGVPYVNVMRIVKNNVDPMCEGASSSAITSITTDSYEIKVNNEIFHSGPILFNEDDEFLSLAPNQPFLMRLIPRNPILEPTPKRQVEFISSTNNALKISFSLQGGIEHTQYSYFDQIEQINNSVKYLNYVDFAYGYTQVDFCLSPKD